MANVLRFNGRECRLIGRTWEAVDHDSDDLIDALNQFTATLDGPGPADGFTTLGRHLAIVVAREMFGTIVELDEVEIPDDEEGTIY